MNHDLTDIYASSCSTIKVFLVLTGEDMTPEMAVLIHIYISTANASKPSTNLLP